MHHKRKMKGKGGTKEKLKGSPPPIGITKKLWREVTDGFEDNMVKRVSFVCEKTGVDKTITLCGPNVMGAMCAYCGAGPMKLTNLFANHFAKSKCLEMVFVDTLGNYVKRKHDDEDRSEEEGKKKQAKSTKNKKSATDEEESSEEDDHRKVKAKKKLKPKSTIKRRTYSGGAREKRKKITAQSGKEEDEKGKAARGDNITKKIQ
jgi:hypothetical protein